MAGFHPSVELYFARTFGAPTAAQARGWPSIAAGAHTLIAAPTGSGKTLAGFLSAIDALVRDAAEGRLGDETRVVYVSPLKALSNDVEKNLRAPLEGIDRALAELGLPPHGIRVGLRTGDTPHATRASTLKRPPHIFVTTPESLYILLTTESGRRMLKTTRAVIVDEIHATIGSKRGAHLALSLERLDALVEPVTGRRAQRIGLSATQKPIDLVGRFLTGGGDCAIVDEGHARAIDMAIEVPGSPLEPVMATEVWDEVFDRIAALVREHETTLVFVNTRRMSERVAKALGDRLGQDKVGAHHGSLSREVRLAAESRLKAGELSALVATASMELGIDVGSIDLVCQVGSPRAIAALLQRVGRSGHSLRGLPKGRLFPTTRDDLVECLALLECAERRELDRAIIPEAPLDVLAQQLVAWSAADECDAGALFERVRRAWSYRALAREDFDAVVAMLAQGFSTRRGRRGAHVHFDAVNGRLRGRRGARIVAVTSGGAIPENAEYAVLQQPEGLRVGSLHEDFAIESNAGDIFQLGTTSWKILRVVPGAVHVEDARGAPPTIPFWLGEAPGRPRELSQGVMRLMARPPEEIDGPDPARRQAAEYLAAARAALGELPGDDVLVAERFFDEAGNTHLVIHSRHGARINRAWGLALRKTFCRSFNFELQAAATDDALILSLGPTHSFPLEEAFTMLKSKVAERVLVQAVLAAPVFGIRWRWASTISLSVPRMRNGKKTPPPLQRMLAEDLLTVVFPDAQACLENIVGDREVPDHPLVRQVLRDCLEEAMDVRGLVALLERVERGEVRTVARDLTTPSPLAAEILGARPYAFLDDAPLEERRTQAVMNRRFADPNPVGDLGALDAAAIARVRDEAWPDPRSRDEAHDALVVFGFLTDAEARGAGPVARGDLRPWLLELGGERRATLATLRSGAGVWVAAERLSELRAAIGDVTCAPPIEPAPGCDFVGDRDRALRELLRSRLEGLGPITAEALARPLGLGADDVRAALAALEVEGFAMRGRFTPGAIDEEWCERRLLARVHRATLERLRKEIEPVTPAELMRFYFAWQHATPDTRARGSAGLELVLARLEGFEAPAAAWESELLPSRMQGWDPAWLDALCVTGRALWARGAEATNARSPVRATPVVILDRTRVDMWRAIRPRTADLEGLSDGARAVHDALERRGALFAQDLAQMTRLGHEGVIDAIAELVARGAATSDSWSGLRSLVTPAKLGDKASGVARAGRWSLVDDAAEDPAAYDEAVEAIARVLLRRWGVVFRKLLEREGPLPPWRDLVRALRRLEARGEVRGGRFVALHSGEQFALPEAVGLLRELRRRPPPPAVVVVSAVDPLALAGIVTPGERVASVAQNKVVWRGGVAVAAIESGAPRWLGDFDPATRDAVITALRRPHAAVAGA